eukprot:scaffold3072_cov116-Isochrysis_galbana.AAC.1
MPRAWVRDGAWWRGMVCGAQEIEHCAVEALIRRPRANKAASRLQRQPYELPQQSSRRLLVRASSFRGLPSFPVHANAPAPEQSHAWVQHRASFPPPRREGAITLAVGEFRDQGQGCGCGSVGVGVFKFKLSGGGHRHTPTGGPTPPAPHYLRLETAREQTYAIKYSSDHQSPRIHGGGRARAPKMSRLGHRLQGPQGQSTLHLRRTLCRPCADLWRVFFLSFKYSQTSTDRDG